MSIYQTYRYLISFFLFTSCCTDVSLKCDYVYNRNSKIYPIKDFFSEIIIPKKDTVFKYSYFETDSCHTIMKDFSHELLEFYTDSTYLLYGSFLLKNNVSIGTQWKSKDIDQYCDSVTITLRDFFQKKRFHEYVSHYCYVYEVDYSKVTNCVLEWTSYIIYFDFEKKILLKRDCFNEHVLLGSEELVRITKIPPPPR